MSIQHSSNFQNQTMRTMISLLEISKERLMEVVPADKQNHINVLFTSANLFAQEIEALQKEVERLSLEAYKNKILLEMVDEQDVIITNLRKDLDGMSRVNKTMGDVIWTATVHSREGVKDTHV